MARLRVHLEGESGGIAVSTFLDVMRDALYVLRDLDSAISENPRGLLDWVVAGLGTNSLDAIVEGRERSRPPAGLELDAIMRVASTVTTTYVDGIRTLEKDGDTPPYFSEGALARVRDTAKLVETGRGGLYAVTLTELETERRARVSEYVGANAARILAPRFVAWGAVIGRLEMISVHRGNRFNVYEDVTNRAVTCRFGHGKLDEVREALGHRVTVEGMVHRNVHGNAIKVEMDSLRTIPASLDLPSVDDLVGSDPEFTGDLTTQEYLDQARGR